MAFTEPFLNITESDWHYMKRCEQQKVFSTQMHLENWCCFGCKLSFFFIGLFVKLTDFKTCYIVH